MKALNCRCAFALQLYWLVWFSPLHHLYLFILHFDVAVQFLVGTAHRWVLCFCFLDEENVFSPQLLLDFAASNTGSLSYCSFFPPRLQNWRSKAACQKVTMTTRSMTRRWMTRGKKITQKSVRQSGLHVQFNRKKQVFAGGLICCLGFFSPT